MDAGVATLVALALAYAGMASLCLAMDRHHKQVWGRDASDRARWSLRCAGSLLLALAALPCTEAWGASVGVVAWLGLLSAAALLVAGSLPYAPRWSARLPIVAVLAAGLAMAGWAGLA